VLLHSLNIVRLTDLYLVDVVSCKQVVLIAQRGLALGADALPVLSNTELHPVRSAFAA